MTFPNHPVVFQAISPDCANGKQKGEVAWLLPGLGSRFVGMGGDILGCDPAADRVAQEASRVLGYDVAAACLEGSGRKDVAPRTEAQLVYVIDCAYVEVLRSRGYEPALVCGHSLGTWAAAYAIGIFDFETGLRLVNRAEDLMEATIPPATQAMGVVIGLHLERLEAILADQGRVFLANWNSPGQYVVAGECEAVEQVLTAAEKAGAYKTKRLGYERACHTLLLQELCTGLAETLQQLPLRAPSVPLVSGHDGSWLQGEAAVRRYLAEFLALPVGWEGAMRGLLSAGHGLEFVEVGPGTVLSDLMGFIDRRVPVQTVSEFLREVARL